MKEKTAKYMQKLSDQTLLKEGLKVKYTGTSDEQVRWGDNDDPRKVLTEGNTYEIVYVEPHSWHTKVRLKGFEIYKFNSVSFEVVLA